MQQYTLNSLKEQITYIVSSKVGFLLGYLSTSVALLPLSRSLSPWHLPHLPLLSWADQAPHRLDWNSEGNNTTDEYGSHSINQTWAEGKQDKEVRN